MFLKQNNFLGSLRLINFAVGFIVRDIVLGAAMKDKVVCLLRRETWNRKQAIKTHLNVLEGSSAHAVSLLTFRAHKLILFADFFGRINLKNSNSSKSSQIRKLHLKVTL
jgi:hypothetical protein